MNVASLPENFTGAGVKHNTLILSGLKWQH
jgi:hypothetical protein